METFNFKVEQNYTVQQEPDINVLTFGDGYQQTSPRGLNHNRKKYQGLVVRANKEVAIQLRRFLNSHGGYRKFLWEDQVSDQILKVRCSSWSYTNLGAVIEFSLNFEEVV